MFENKSICDFILDYSIGDWVRIKTLGSPKLMGPRYPDEILALALYN